jgi:excisionase family DNA binding protein
MNLLNTTDAAQRLGISVRRVLALIEEGKLRAQKVGRDYAIEEGALEGVKVYGKAGRPPKATPAANERATGKARATGGASTGKKKGGKK